MKTLAVLLGLTSLLLAGCGTKPPLIVERERLLVVEPPSSCLATIDWDRDFDPYGQSNRELAQSWAARGDALAIAEERLACVRSAVQAAKRAAAPTPGAG